MIFDEVENYNKIKKYDIANNDMQREILSYEAQTFAVSEAAESDLYSGYSELWEDGFHCEDEKDYKKREYIEWKMNTAYKSYFEELIEDFLENSINK